MKKTSITKVVLWIVLQYNEYVWFDRDTQINSIS